MSQLWQELCPTLEKIYQPSSTQLIWGVQCAPAGKPSGFGELFSDAQTLADRIASVNAAGGAMHICLSALSGWQPGMPTNRGSLTPEFTTAVVLDIDFKDQDTHQAEVLDRLNKMPLPPTVLADSANGLHVYYLFDVNIIEYLRSIHRTLQSFYMAHGVKVDPAHSSPRCTIRSLGSLGKSGAMTVGAMGAFNGPVYTIPSMQTALGVQSFEQLVVNEKTLYNSWKFSLHPQINREQLLSSCGAFKQFHEDASTKFERGTVSTYHDARIFGSLVAHTWDDSGDVGDMDARRDYFMSDALEYPGHTPADAQILFEGVLNTPALRCDKWSSPRYTDHCNNCRYGSFKHADSPIDAAIADQQALQYTAPAPAAPAQTETPEQPVLSLVPPPTQVVPKYPVTPDGYYVKAAQGSEPPIMMEIIPPKKPGGDETYVPVFQPAFCISAMEIVMFPLPHSPVYQDYKIMMMHDATREYHFKQEALNNQNTLKTYCSGVGIFVFDGMRAVNFLNRSRSQPTVEQIYVANTLGWHANNQRFMQVGTVISKNETAPIEASGAVRDVFAHPETGYIDHMRAKGDVTTWRDNCLTPFVHEPSLSNHLLCILSAFAAPLYSLTGRESGPVLNFHGDTSTGKTSALEVANSIFFDTNSMALTPRDTKHAMFLKLGMYRHMPVTLDEASLVRPDDIYELAYLMTGGREKNAGSIDGGLRSSSTWNTCVLCAANHALRSVVSNVAKANEAVYNRIIDFRIPNEVTTPTNRSLIRNAVAMAEHNHGVAGMVYIQEVLGQTAKLQGMFTDRMNEGKYAKAGRFFQRHAVLIELAASILVSCNLLNANQMPVIEQLLDGIDDNVSIDVEGQLDVQRTAVNDFIGYIQQRALPGKKKEFREWVMGLGGNIQSPDLAEHCHEGDTYYALTNPFIKKYLLTLRNDIPMSQFLDDCNVELKTLGHLPIRKRGGTDLPIVEGPVAHAGSKMSTTRQRVWLVPKI